jgi:hypothetical protein
MSEFIEKYRVRVNSLVKAEASCLISVRNHVQRNPSLGKILVKAKDNDWTNEKYLSVITPKVDDVFEFPLFQVQQSLLYLLDEFKQLGSQGVLIISRRTGEAFAQIREEDVVQLAPVPRDGGRLVNRPPQVNPELIAFITEYASNEEFELEVLKKTLARLVQTDLQKQEGDSRLNLLSREGRNDIARTISSYSQEVMGFLRGEHQRVWRKLCAPKESILEPWGSRTLDFDVEDINIPDTLSMSLRFDWQNKYTLSIAKNALTRIVGDLGKDLRNPKRLDEFKGDVQDILDFVVVPMNQTSFKTEPVYLAQCSNIFGLLHGEVARVEFNKFEVNAVELFGRWIYEVHVEYNLYVDGSKLQLLDVGPISFEATVAK